MHDIRDTHDRIVVASCTIAFLCKIAFTKLTYALTFYMMFTDATGLSGGSIKMSLNHPKIGGWSSTYFGEGECRTLKFWTTIFKFGQLLNMAVLSCSVR